MQKQINSRGCIYGFQLHKRFRRMLSHSQLSNAAGRPHHMANGTHQLVKKKKKSKEKTMVSTVREHHSEEREDGEKGKIKPLYTAIASRHSLQLSFPPRSQLSPLTIPKQYEPFCKCMWFGKYVQKYGQHFSNIRIFVTVNIEL